MKFPFLLTVMAAILFAGCSKPGGRTAKSAALATVGGKEIFPSDLTAEAQRRATAGQPVPDKKALLNEMVLEEAMVQRALALKLDKDPEAARIWRSLLIGTLKSHELEPKLKGEEISPAEVQAWYAAEQPSFAQPEKARIGLIFAAVPPRAPAEQVAPVRSRIDEARAMAAGGADGFKQAAAKYSDHQASRYRGGETGWVLRGKPPAYLPAKVAEAAFALQPGALSGVLEDKDGLYLVTLLEHTAASFRPLAQVEAGIRTTLTRQHQESLRRSFDEQVCQLAGVQTFPEVLQQTELPVPSRAQPEPPAVPGNANN